MRKALIYGRRNSVEGGIIKTILKEIGFEIDVIPSEAVRIPVKEINVDLSVICGVDIDENNPFYSLEKIEKMAIHSNQVLVIGESANKWERLISEEDGEKINFLRLHETNSLKDEITSLRRIMSDRITEESNS